MTIEDHIDYSQRLRECATALPDVGVDGFIQPVNDQFQSEYPPESAKRLEWLCGFTGSAGTVICFAEPVYDKRGALFTDGRYTIQAEQEVAGEDYHRLNSTQRPVDTWLIEAVQAAGYDRFMLGFDPWLHSAAQIARWTKAFIGTPVELKPLDGNPIDALWAHRPPPPAAAIKLHPVEYTGESSVDKCARLADAIRRLGADAALLALPDGVNWLLNIRGEDIAYNPLALCMALLDANGRVTVFLNGHNTADAAFDEAVTISSMQQLEQEPASFFKAYPHILFDPATSAEWLRMQLEQAGVQIIEGRDPTLLPKACKNATEIAGIRNAHRRDGRALSQFLQWLDDTVAERPVTELETEQMINDLRRDISGPLYLGPSFATIAGSGEHGAIVHYRATDESDRILHKNELFLFDSGGQYLDGTTDVTRTVVIGEPDAEMREHFTRVLKGHIAIATAVFPEGTTGAQLDALARQYLWEAGCDYDHGTGHGVGAYLCVHEGPQRISKRGGDVALAPGMVLSNEPGYYRPGAYGIRIENLVLVVPSPDYDGFLTFETLTLAPLDTRLIDEFMLSERERDWLGQYHARVEANMLHDSAAEPGALRHLA